MYIIVYTHRCILTETLYVSSWFWAECLAFHAAMIDTILTNSLNLWLSSLAGNCPLMVNYMLWSGFVPSAWYFTYYNCAEYSQGLSSAADLHWVSSFRRTGCLRLRLRKCLDFKLHLEILNALKCTTFTKQCLDSRDEESPLWTHRKFNLLLQNQFLKLLPQHSKPHAFIGHLRGIYHFQYFQHTVH